MKVLAPFNDIADDVEPILILPALPLPILISAVDVSYSEILSVVNKLCNVFAFNVLLKVLTPVKVWDRFKYAILLRLYTMPFIVILVGVIIMVLLPSTIVIFFGMVNAPCATG